MTWTNEKTIKQQLDKLWNKGIFLSALLNGECLFPLKLKCVKPSTQEITDNFEQVRHWVAELTTIPYVDIEWQTIQHRIQGKQQLPASLSINNIETILKLLQKQKIYHQFQQQIAQTQAVEPLLLGWLEQYPFKALNYAESWQKLLSVLTWKKAHPTPNIYLRQVDLPQIHSKFIEQNKAILAELFDYTLPPQEINTDYSGINQFTRRYGFLDKPKLIRFRNLDDKQSIFPTISHSDLALDSRSFAQLTPPITRVIIVENEINYLTLPQLRNSWAIFGAGYGWQALREAKWLHQCELFYWGDIDTHGFAILNQLRHIFPHTQSLLMDKKTLLANQPYWSREATQQSAQLEHLTQEEQQLYTALQSQQFGEHVRLEQEFIPFTQIIQQLHQRLLKA